MDSDLEDFASGAASSTHNDDHSDEEYSAKEVSKSIKDQYEIINEQVVIIRTWNLPNLLLSVDLQG